MTIDELLVETVKQLPSVIPTLITAFVGLGGVWYGGHLTRRNDQARLQLDFVEQQLRDFYGPLLGLRAELRALGELRVRVNEAIDMSWRELCDRATAQGGHQALIELTKTREQNFTRTIDYDNEKLRNDEMPAYDRMLAIFRDKYFLAQSSTQAHLPALIEFVELWHRFLDKTIPGEPSPN